MKLRNKKTGEVKNFLLVTVNGYAGNDTLADLNEEWEDYEEPKGIQDVYDVKDYVYIQMRSEEEAEKAVEKLMAWKRLKDKGFQFVNFTLENKGREGLIHFMCEQPCDKKELTKVFGEIE